MQKLLAIASFGGHWIQLQRLKPLFDEFETIYVSTNKKLKSDLPNSKYFCVKEASRWSKLNLLVCFFMVFIIIIKQRPKIIITTGAAPGLMAIISGRVIGAKTIWIDSIANVEELSLSGNIAMKFAHRVYTQWPDLANSNILYSGNVLS